VTTAVTSERAVLGGAAPGFSQVAATDGRHYSLSSFGGREVLVLVFLGNGCPTAKSCEDGLIELQAAYDARGVGLVAINPNNPYLSPPDTLREMSRRARAKGYNFPYLKDSDATLARAYGMTRTPQVCVLDSDRVLRYRGRIFDARDPARVHRCDLQEAVDDLLSHREVRVPETDAFGCSIVW
jgi:peroxiredoxin